jgi:hypothetical protein
MAVLPCLRQESASILRPGSPRAALRYIGRPFFSSGVATESFTRPRPVASSEAPRTSGQVVVSRFGRPERDKDWVILEWPHTAARGCGRGSAWLLPYAPRRIRDGQVVLVLQAGPPFRSWSPN